MKLIIGIGNPEGKYERTRHNVGQMLVEFLKSKNLQQFKLLNSDKFMNNSGEFVAKQIKNLNIKIEDLYIAHDDLDIKLGEYKITVKAPKDHNGIISINESLESEDYFKIRIGVDNRDPENRIEGEKYVLQNFSEDEVWTLQEVFEKIYLKLG